MTCTDTTATRAGNSVSFTVDPGDDIVCTFTNVKDATVTYVKADQSGFGSGRLRLRRERHGTER